MNFNYEFVVIGAGPGGLTVAAALGVMNKKVCLIEKGHIGGDCTNYGCVPSKALLDIARKHRFDSLDEAMQYVRELREEIREEETPEVLASYNVETLFGTASFEDTHTLFVDHHGNHRKITAKKIIIATGSRAREISIPGVAEEKLLTNETLFEISEEIKHLVIIGGGVISCEMGEAFANLGIHVTLLDKHDRILHTEDSEVSEAMYNHLTSVGVDVRLQSQVLEGQDEILFVKNGKDRVEEIPYDKILLAIGRVPNVETLHLDNAGVTYTHGGVVTDNKARTNIGNIFAIGDCVAGNPKFTHWSNNEGRILVQNLLSPLFMFSGKKGHPLPTTIYTSVEFARVGMTEAQAVEKHGRDNLVIRTHPFAKNDRSKLTETRGGFMKVIAKRLSLKIVGVTIVDEKAGEILPQFTIAMKKGISLRGLSKVIYAYPTKSEIIKRLIDEYLLELSKNWKDEVRWMLKKLFLFWRR